MRRPGRTALGWAVLALLGLVLAAGAAYAASRLATQPIGLSSQPITAGRELAPRAARTARQRTSRATRTATSTPTATPTTDDDRGGGRRNDGDGDSDDD